MKTTTNTTNNFETIKKDLASVLSEAQDLILFPYFNFFTKCDELSDSEFEQLWTERLDQLDFSSVYKFDLISIVRRIYNFNEHWKERVEYWSENTHYPDPSDLNYDGHFLPSSKKRYSRSLWLFNIITSKYITDDMRKII